MTAESHGGTVGKGNCSSSELGHYGLSSGEPASASPPGSRSRIPMPGHKKDVDSPPTLLIVTDGRGEYLTRCIESALENIGDLCPGVIVDDSGRHQYGDWLRTKFPGWWTVSHPERRGLAAAIQTGWAHIPNGPIFHLEDDFTFQGPPDVAGMVGLLAFHDVAQVCLLRQPVNHEEEQAGGVIQANTAQFRPSSLDYPTTGVRYVYEEHSDLFWLNPCIYPQWVRDVGWPDGGGEREFTDRLQSKYPDARFAVWGSRHDPPAVWHIGNYRSQGWKL